MYYNDNCSYELKDKIDTLDTGGKIDVSSKVFSNDIVESELRSCSTVLWSRCEGIWKRSEIWPHGLLPLFCRKKILYSFSRWQGM